MELPDFLSKPISYWNLDAESCELLGPLAPVAVCPDTSHLPASRQEVALALSFHTVDAQDLVSSLELACGTHIQFILFPGSISLVFRPISGPVTFQAPFPDTCPTLKLCLIFQTFSKSGLALHPPQTPIWTVSEIFPLYLVTLCSHGARVSRSS